MALLADQSADVNSNLVTGSGTESVLYTVPGNVPVKVESVVATITNAAASAVTPELTIRDQSGVVIARKAQRSTIPAGDSGTATFALRLDDDVASTPVPATLDELILSHSPAGFWKLNESSGHIAADSSGNSVDMSTAVPEVDPNWAQAAGPPGQQTADFNVGSSGLGGTASRVSHSWPVISGDFTAGVWAWRHTLAASSMFGQGNPSRAGGEGWQLGVSTPGGGNKPEVNVAGTGLGELLAVNALPIDTWAFIAVTHNTAAHEWKLYVNGLLEKTQTTGTFTPASGPTPLWIGHDGGLGSNAIQTCLAHLSYAFLIMSVLSAAELLAINDAAAL